jgi:geranylgeranyl pyrophosphate synthase
MSENEFTPLIDFDPSPEIMKNYKKYIDLNIDKSELKNIQENKIKLLKQKSGDPNIDKISLADAYSFLSNINDFKRELKDINKFILEKISEDEENKLKELSEYNFLMMGKMIRPVLIILVSKYIHECKINMLNLSDPTLKKKILISDSVDIETEDFFKSKKFNQIVKPFAACVEVVHNASLLHDDIIDNSNERRSRKTAHNIYGIRETVFSANFIISKAANVIIDLDYKHLSQIYSGIVLKLTEGECQQSLKISNLKNLDESFYVYMHKTYYKTASLLALSLRGVGIIYDLNVEYQKKLFDLGLHLGLVFQLVDDVLDVLYDSVKIQKPALKDLKEGVINSHILYECIFSNEMLELASRKFKGEKDIEKAVEILNKGLGILKTENLAMDHLLDSVNIISDEFFIDNQTKKDLFRCFHYLIKRCY